MENELLGSLLQDPDLMNKLQAMAQSLGLGNAPPSSPAAPAAPPPPAQEAINPAALFATVQADKNQQALLRALGPYLGQDRLSRLEKAMRAAQMAKLATGLLGGKNRV